MHSYTSCIHMHASKLAKTLTHTYANTHLFKVLNYYKIAPYTIKCKTNLESICGAPTEALAEASGAAEGVYGSRISPGRE